MPVVATENFTGVANTPLQGKTTTTGGLTWQAAGVFPLNRGSAQLFGDGTGWNNTYGECLVYVNAGSADHYAQVRILSRLTNEESICATVAAVDHQNCIYLAPFFATDQYKITKKVANVRTDVATISGLTFASGDVFRLERQGTTIKAFQNGLQIGDVAGYTVADAVFDGVTNVGLWSLNASDGALMDDFEAGNFGGAVSTLTFTTQPVANSVLQRNKTTGTKAVPVAGAYTGTLPTDIQWRLETETAALVSGYDWTTISGATISGGTWSGSVTVPQDTARTGYRILVRSRDGATVLDTQTSAVFTVGTLIHCGGQSNMGGQMFNGTGPGIGNKCAYWNGTSWNRTFVSAGSALISNASDLLGLPVGFAVYFQNATGVRQHSPAHTSTDGSITEGSFWAPVLAQITEVGGDVEAAMWFQGEADIGSRTTQQYKDALNARIAGLKTATGRTVGSEFKHGIVVVGRNPGGGIGTSAGWDAIRLAQAQVAAETVGAFIATDAITYDMADSVHLSNTAYPQICYAEARSLAVALGASTFDGRGPRVLSASISGSTVTVNFTLNGSAALTGSGTLTGWEFFNGSVWAAAGTPTRVGNTVTFTGAGATQIRYLYGQDPVVTNVLRGDVKGAAAATSNLPVEPTRLAVVVTAPVVKLASTTLTTDGTTAAASLTGLRWAWWDAAPPNLATAPVISGTTGTTNASGVFTVTLTGTTLNVGQTGTLLVLTSDGTAGSTANRAYCAPVVVS